jgi:hypothetical protein
MFLNLQEDFKLTFAFENIWINSWASGTRSPETKTDQLGEDDLFRSRDCRTLTTDMPSRRARTTVSTPTGISSPTVFDELTAAAAS